jgi:RNA polymerase sigma-70 factor
MPGQGDLRVVSELGKADAEARFPRNSLKICVFMSPQGRGPTIYNGGRGFDWLAAKTGMERRLMKDAREKKAFEILVSEHSSMLNAYLRCFLSSDAVIEDLFQETMVVAWRRLDECDLALPFGPWLRGIASKLVLAHFRQLKRFPVSLNADVLERVEANFAYVQLAEGDTWEDKLAGLQDCLERLPEEYLQIIRLHYHDGESVRSMAGLLQLSLEACKKRLQRARLRIADCLRSKGLLANEAGG